MICQCVSFNFFHFTIKTDKVHFLMLSESQKFSQIKRIFTRTFISFDCMIRYLSYMHFIILVRWLFMFCLNFWHSVRNSHFLTMLWNIRKTSHHSTSQISSQILWEFLTFWSTLQNIRMYLIKPTLIKTPQMKPNINLKQTLCWH